MKGDTRARMGASIRDILDTGKFTPAGHRGARREFPENTIPSFRRALEIFPDCLLETDVHASIDGEAVVMHDAVLEAKTDGRGPVGMMPMTDIRKLDAGYNIAVGGSYPFRGRGFRVPSLGELLCEFPDALFSVDIKDDSVPFADSVIALLKECGAADRVIIGSFHDRVMARMRAGHPKIARSFSRLEVVRFLAMQKAGLTRFFHKKDDAIFGPEFLLEGDEDAGTPNRGMRVITKRFIDAAHGRGIPVFAWTVNDQENMKQLIGWGVNGIVTDYPDRLKEVMGETGSVINDRK